MKKMHNRFWFSTVFILFIFVVILSGESVWGEREVVAPKAAVAIEIGASSLNGTYTAGTYGQGTMRLVYQYSPLLSLTLNEVPLAIVQIPSEIGDQLVGNPTKQASFLKSLTGTITYPLNTLANQSFDIQSVSSNVIKTYNEATHAVVFTYPRSTTLLTITNIWKVDMIIDAGVLYKNSITVPPAYNGVNYTAKGTLVAATEGITISTGNTKMTTIPSATFGIGNYPVLGITPPKLNDTMQHLGTVISGTANQVLDTNYTYTADIIYKTRAGVTTTITNLPVAINGSFTTTLATPYEYGDTATAILKATSKINTDTYESQPSPLITAKWPVQPATLTSPKVGETQITGTASESNPGVYKAHITINQTSYDTPLQANGTFALTGIPDLRLGDQISVTIDGYSTRTGERLISSTATMVSVIYNMPMLAITQQFERKNAADVWEIATDTASDQEIRYTITTTLQNSNAVWNKQNIKINIPVGLIDLKDITLAKISTTTETQLTAPTTIDDSTSPSLKSLFSQITNNPLISQGDKIRIQFSAKVIREGYPASLISKVWLNGETDNTVPILEQTNSMSILVTDGTLKLVEVPNTIAFTNIPVPSKPQTYNRTNTVGTIKVRDGRVKKTIWQLFIREQTPLTNANNQQLHQSIIYSQNGADTLLNSENQPIFAHKVENNQVYELVWQASEGIRLKLAPSPDIKINQHYTGELVWTLTDTPT
ncbi:hypothetical protein [Listeria grandensis]|uniref:hypothetical protein n=1 Tax=Listeria grandensis TaxID=1494963 RepID=UPI00164DCD70|nr:hypothetical protein [Listeria grandensis]MBC6316637.1 hypothetical protein [Listeria grandensis]